jgi:UDP-N-acetylglucosamine--N-acetylmuramyl-(pentapeptide) pyrophosphoryl-undecaprenol N-acetylglucosamine transferase
LHNARAFETAGGGWLIEQDDLTPARLGSWLGETMADPDRLAAAAAGAVRFGRPDAVVRLADLIESLGPGRATGRAGTDFEVAE